MSQSRGPFNKLCDFYATTLGIPATTPYATAIPCRFVEQDQIAPYLMPFSARVAWVTMDEDVPYMELPVIGTDGSITQKYQASDRVKVSGVGDTLWVVIMVETVTPTGEATYTRVWIAEAWWGLIPP